jgi:hypothetical protein
MTLPHLPSVDPGDNPDRFARELLDRYFTPGWIDSVIRTWVPVAIGAVLSWVNANYGVLGLPDHPSSTAVIVATGLTIAGYYALARVVERRWPKVGAALVAVGLVRTKPVYGTAAAAKAVDDVASGAALRRSMS